MTTTTATQYAHPLPRTARGSKIGLALSLFTATLVLISTVGVFIVANDEVARQAVLGAIGAQDADARPASPVRP